MKRVLYVVEDEKNAQYRYRCKNVQAAVRGSGEYEVEIVVGSELARGRLAKADLLVIERQTDKSGEVGKLVREAQARGVKVLMDLDDLVFDYRDVPVLMRATNSRNVLYWLGYVWGIRRVARKVEGFLCTNEFLGRKLERSFGKPWRVIRNSLNAEQVKVSEKYRKQKEHEGFVVGYFSGSPTHKRDLALVAGEVVEFLRAYKDARLEVVGCMELPRELVGDERVEHRELVDYLELQRLMAEVDVNVAPLVYNDFTNCKSELKFFEAGVVETTTIASLAYTFERAIRDGENGFLAQPGEWYEKLEYLYKHPDENRKMARAARKDALQHYYGEEFLKEVEEAYEYFAG